MTAPSGFEGELITISFVFGVIFARNASTSIWHSGGSSAYVTGVAPQIFASVAYETKPGLGTSTSSPGFTYAVKIEKRPSCVPAVTHTSLFGSNGVSAHNFLRNESAPAFGEYCHGIV